MNGLRMLGLVAGIVILGTMLLSANVFFHGAEALLKKSKVKVYITKITKIPSTYNPLVKVCLADDDSNCHGQKTIDLRKASHGGTKSKILVSTFKITFSTNPEDEFGPGDVSACGKFVYHGRTSNDCAYGNLKTVNKNQYKASISYLDLLDKFYGNDKELPLIQFD